MLTLDRAQRARNAPKCRTLLGGVLLLGLCAVSASARAQPYTGPQVSRAVSQSLDIMKDHVTFLSLQDRRDAALGYFAFTHRMAPMTLVLNDGSTSSNIGHRATIMEGLGFGSPKKFAAFVGAWNDVVAIGPSKSDRVSFQGIAFGGIGLFGFQATYSRFVGQDLGGLDIYGNFTTGGEGDHQAAASSHQFVPITHDGFSFYHETGASLVIMRSRFLDGERRVSDVRAQLQPLKDYLKEWVHRKVGLPIVAIQKLRDNIRAASEVKPLQTQTVTQPETPTYEFELGGDDLLGIGLRVHSVTEFSPKFRFARAEAGLYRDIGEGPGSLTIAMRSTAFARSSSLEVSVDAFARVAIIPVGKEHVGFPIHAAISYSYNSPDSVSFLPLPRAHVFGYQFIIGLPDIARPLVPIVRPKEDPAEVATEEAK